MALVVLTPIGQGHLESADAEGMDAVVFGTQARPFWRSGMAGVPTSAQETPSA